MNVDLPHTRFLETSSDRATRQWDDLLTLQVDLFLAHEVDLLQSIDSWSAAQSVVDVGCGNGYYLSRLQAMHRDKTCVGIDLSKELIAIARQRYTRHDLDYAQMDFLSGEDLPVCDFILLRFVVQHLQDFDLVLKRASRALEDGGGLLILESDLAASVVRPSMPLFSGLLQAFEAHQAKVGALRTRIKELPAVAAATPGWRVALDRTVAIPAVGPFLGSRTLAVFVKWVDLCETSGDFDYPFEDTRNELRKWAALDSASSRISLRALLLSFQPGR